jgi:hypothetical protein
MIRARRVFGHAAENPSGWTASTFFPQFVLEYIHTTSPRIADEF